MLSEEKGDGVKDAIKKKKKKNRTLSCPLTPAPSPLCASIYNLHAGGKIKKWNVFSKLFLLIIM